MSEVLRIRALCTEVPREGPSTVSVSVLVVADLVDGRVVTLLDDRGWGGTVSGGADIWDVLDEQALLRDVANVLLPDDAETSGEEQEWRVYAEQLAAAGVTVTVDDLRRLPFVVDLGTDLRSRLRG